MIEVFDYKIYELNKIKKQYIVVGALTFIAGLGISLLLLFLHDRSNSFVMSIFTVLAIFIFSFIGLFFLLIKLTSVKKIIEIIKKKNNLLRGKYVVKKIENEYFSMGGLSYRKIFVVDKDENVICFYLLKGFELKEKDKINIGSYNSIIVDYEIL